MEFSINKRVAYRLTLVGILALAATANTAKAVDAPQGIDPGYGSLPNGLIDVNNDGLEDYCRFVGPGTPDQMFISCALQTQDGRFQQSLKNYRSPKGIDQGYPSLPRGFQAAGPEGQPAYCRFVGPNANQPNIHESCLLGGTRGFNGGNYDTGVVQP
ncbi:hypothetical protein H6G27_06310 [Nostoc linckia FACHB-104]|nr:hypothetical protein [Nostoc linckia FACHB-104]